MHATDSDRCYARICTLETQGFPATQHLVIQCFFVAIGVCMKCHELQRDQKNIDLRVLWLSVSSLMVSGAVAVFAGVLAPFSLTRREM